MNNNTRFESKIKELKERLENLEDTDPFYMGNDLQYLRHKVLFVHARLEASLDYLIIKGLTNHLVHKTTDLENRFTFRKMQTILGEISFAKKIEIAKKLHQLKSPLVGMVRAVNTVRNKLSRITSHQDEVNEFKKSERYVEVMELLVGTMDGMNELFSRFLPLKRQK